MELGIKKEVYPEGRSSTASEWALRRVEDDLIARGCATRSENGQLVMLPIRVPVQYSKE